MSDDAARSARVAASSFLFSSAFADPPTLPGNANKPPEPPPPEGARLCLPFARFAGLPSEDAGRSDVVTATPDDESSAEEEEKGFGERRSRGFPAAKKTLPEEKASSPFAAAAASAAVAASTAGARAGLSAATRARALARAKRRVAPRPAAKPVSSSLKKKGSDDEFGRHERRHGDVGGASEAPSKRRSDPLAASFSSPCHGPSGASAGFNARRRKCSGEDEAYVE